MTTTYIFLLSRYRTFIWNYQLNLYGRFSFIMASPLAEPTMADPMLLEKIDKLFELNIGQYVDLPQVRPGLLLDRQVLRSCD